MVTLAEYAELEIFKRHADDVSVFQTRESLRKFGRNDTIGTTEVTVMNLQGAETEETYATGNTIDKVVSSNASNTQSINIEGHTIDGSNNLTFVSQNVTLTGQTAVTLGTPLARVQRVRNNGTAFIAASNVFVYEDSTIVAGVPSDDTKVHLTVDAIENQSTKAAFSTQWNEYFILTCTYADVNKKTGATVDFRWKERAMTSSLVPAFKTFLPRSTATNVTTLFSPHYIIHPNTDVILTAVASTSNVSVSGGMMGFYARPSGK
jgi:hypothetical protein